MNKLREVGLAVSLSLAAMAGSSTSAGAELVDSTRIVAIDTAVNPASPDSPIAQEAREMYNDGRLLTTYAEKRDYGNKEVNCQAPSFCNTLSKLFGLSLRPAA